jgi:ferredoxin-NADP reductase
MALISPISLGRAPRDLHGFLGAGSAWLRTEALARVDRLSARVEADVPWLEAGLRRLEPTLSLRAVRARVLAVRAETHDVKTFVLRPNARFTDYVPGAFVNVSLRIGGVKHQRSYSISSAPSADGTLSITVKRVSGGIVSNFLADHVHPGDVLTLSAPAGQFRLPEQLPPALLMISAGSGITPVMSMLRQLLAQRSTLAVTFLHFARSPRDLIFHEELLHSAAAMPNLRLALSVEQADEHWTGSRGRFTQELLESVAPNYRELDTFLCGPAPFMKGVIQALDQTGADMSRLRYERFNVDFDASECLEQAQLVRFLRSGGESLSKRPATILHEAERLGLTVESGCRAGNCGTCRCLKRSGVVTDVTTGSSSGAGEEFILPCISVPRGVVEVEL